MSAGAKDPTSATEVSAASHMGTLTFLEMTFPTWLPFHPFTKAKSAVTRAPRQCCPRNFLASLG